MMSAVIFGRSGSGRGLRPGWEPEKARPMMSPPGLRTC
jgi:hypothetical protein